MFDAVTKHKFIENITSLSQKFANKNISKHQQICSCLHFIFCLRLSCNSLDTEQADMNVTPTVLCGVLKIPVLYLKYSVLDLAPWTPI